MASAANIILNLGRGQGRPYWVPKQGNLFVRTEGRDSMKTINNVLSTVQNAKKIADAVAPFFAKDYQPPVQQAEIAAQQLDAAQQAKMSDERRLKQAEKTVEPFQKTQSQIDILTQHAADAMNRVNSATNESELAAAKKDFEIASEALHMAQARSRMSATRGDFRQDLQDRVNRAQKAVSETSRLPTFQTLAETEAALKSAIASGDYALLSNIVQGIRYSPLSDIRASDLYESQNPSVPRQKALAEMWKRIKLPKGMTPYQLFQQSKFQANEARRQASANWQAKVHADRLNKEQADRNWQAVRAAEQGDRADRRAAQVDKKIKQGAQRIKQGNERIQIAKQKASQGSGSNRPKDLVSLQKGLVTLAGRMKENSSKLKAAKKRLRGLPNTTKNQAQRARLEQRMAVLKGKGESLQEQYDHQSIMVRYLKKNPQAKAVSNEAMYFLTPRELEKGINTVLPFANFGRTPTLDSKEDSVWDSAIDGN